MPIEYNYITAFIQRMENSPPTFAPHCKGYVPMRNGIALGSSGVTIGTGIDLGQQTAKGLAAMGVSASLIGALTPYLGLKKQAAITKLVSLPFVLSPNAVAALDHAVISSYTRATAIRFDSVAGRDYPSFISQFSDRQKQVQAVAVSLEYQLGPHGASFFISELAAGNYSHVIQKLQSQTNYQHRRKKEASLLQEISLN